MLYIAFYLFGEIDVRLTFLISEKEINIIGQYLIIRFSVSV